MSIAPPRSPHSPFNFTTFELAVRACGICFSALQSVAQLWSTAARQLACCALTWRSRGAHCAGEAGSGISTVSHLKMVGFLQGAAVLLTVPLCGWIRLPRNRSSNDSQKTTVMLPHAHSLPTLIYNFSTISSLIYYCIHTITHSLISENLAFQRTS